MSFLRQSSIDNAGEHSNDASRRQYDVEIATLSMPAVAAGSGVISGEGTNFVLEAPTHIIEQLVESESQHEQQRLQKQPCIEGVVDLEVVSQLVEGITGEEFVGLLHQDVPHQHHQNSTTASAMLEPLLEGVAFTAQAEGQVEDEEKGQGEDQPLLHGSSNISGDQSTTCMSISADAFVHTLSEVHHQDKDQTSKVATPGKNDGKAGEGASAGATPTIVETIGAPDTLSSSFRSSFFRGDHHVDNSGATMAREAFLVSVPSMGPGTGLGPITGSNYSGVSSVSIEVGDKFMLAMPEMQDQSKEKKHDNGNQSPGEFELTGGSRLAGSFLRHSMTVAETVAEVKNEMNHAFDPLPTDVQHVDLRVSIYPTETKVGGVFQEEVHLDVVVDRKVPVIGYVILVTGLVALSSVGAALELQQGGVTPEMKIFWRLNATSILFLGLAGKKLNREELGRLTWTQLYVELPFAAANYAAMNAGFAVALDMIPLVNAFVLSNMSSLLMILAKFGLGIPVKFFEGLGALIGFGGALICAAAGGGDGDGNITDDNRMLQSGNSSEMLGNLVAFSASITTAIYLTVAKRLRPQVDLVLFMFLIFTLGSGFMLLYIIFCSGQEYEFSFDPVIGVFGWVNRQADRLPLELYVAIVCNGMGTMGYVAIMKYFDPVVVSMVMLMEPIVATFQGMAVGVATLPGWVTWAGDAVVMVGSVMVIWSGSRKTETIDATDALEKIKDETVTTPNLMKSPRLMKSPLIVNKQCETDEMEFECVGRKPRAQSTSGDAAQRVIWSSTK